MKLLQRVMAVVRADVNELLEHSHNPEKTLDQLIRDLKNQFIQVKTTIAQSMTDQQTMQRQTELLAQDAAASDHASRAKDVAALLQPEGSSSAHRSMEQLTRQVDVLRREAEALVFALGQLDMKIAEVEKDRELLLSRHDRGNGNNGRAAGAPRPERLEELITAIGGKNAGADAVTATKLPVRK